jgi:hypothetical protein
LVGVAHALSVDGILPLKTPPLSAKDLVRVQGFGDPGVPHATGPCLYAARRARDGKWVAGGAWDLRVAQARVAAHQGGRPDELLFVQLSKAGGGALSAVDGAVDWDCALAAGGAEVVWRMCAAGMDVLP